MDFCEFQASLVHRLSSKATQINSVLKKKQKKSLSYFCVCACSVCMYVCVPHVGLLNPLELGLQMVNHHVGVCWKSNLGPGLSNRYY